MRDPKERLLREPELNDEACARGAEPAESGGDAVEVGAEGLEGLRWEGELVDVSVVRERRGCGLTILVVLGLLLVVLATQLGPFRKVILRRGVCHFAIEFDDFLAQCHASSCLLGLWRGKFGVEEP